ncbi:MAG TPA: 4Fe-4S dicluster domain-containing protein [Verrucomicrobiae bacterium]|nr:4Fe-4S dicluster domain-containing protein [Verrucomicrobiae bacterium]
MLGTGILKGMVETARNFAGSYVGEERLTTVQYPEERLPAKENARQFPFLVFDTSDPAAGLRCVACQICEKECPPQCIYIEKSKDKKPDYVGKPQFYPAVFDIDVSVCMSCQICVEVCPFEAIKMDTEYELSNTDRFGALLLHKTDLAKSNGYYHRIHPTEATEVDERLAAEKAKAEAKAKADAEAKAKAAAEAKAKAAAAAAGGTPAAPATPGAATPAAPAKSAVANSPESATAPVNAVAPVAKPAQPAPAAAKPTESPSTGEGARHV